MPAKKPGKSGAVTTTRRNSAPVKIDDLEIPKARGKSVKGGDATKTVLTAPYDDYANRVYTASRDTPKPGSGSSGSW